MRDYMDYKDYIDYKDYKVAKDTEAATACNCLQNIMFRVRVRDPIFTIHALHPGRRWIRAKQVRTQMDSFRQSDVCYSNVELGEKRNIKANICNCQYFYLCTS